MIYTRRVSQSIAEYIYSRTGRTPVNVLRYAIEDIIDNTLVALPIIILSGINGSCLDGFIAIAAFFLLRSYSGGFHLAKDTHCLIFSTVMLLISIYTSSTYWYNGFVENIVAFLLMMLYAPSGSKAPKDLHRRYKLYSLIIVGSNFLIHSTLLANVFLIQALSTPPIVQRVLNRYNL